MSAPFHLFLYELAKVLLFSTLAPDRKGACLIIMKDGEIPLLFEFDEQLVPNTVLLSCPIAAIPEAYRAEVYEASLIGNGMIEETLSIKPDEDMLYVHRRFHPAIQAIEIEPLLKQFLSTVKKWKEKMATMVMTPPRADHTHPHPSSIQVFPYKA